MCFCKPALLSNILWQATHLYDNLTSSSGWILGLKICCPLCNPLLGLSTHLSCNNKYLYFKQWWLFVKLIDENCIVHFMYLYMPHICKNLPQEKNPKFWDDEDWILQQIRFINLHVRDVGCVNKPFFKFLPGCKTSKCWSKPNKVCLLLFSNSLFKL